MTAGAARTRALICGVTGQDGALLARLLLDKGYEVWGTSRDAETSEALGQLTKSSRIYPLHVLMFTHADKICRPKNPKCDECRLLDLCPDGQRRLKHRPPEPIVRMRGRPMILSRYASAGIPKRSAKQDKDARSALTHV